MPRFAYPCRVPVDASSGETSTATRGKSIGVMVMVEEEKEPDGKPTIQEGHIAHPVDPAEGAREPGEDADEPRSPHPDEPAEGER